MQLTLHFWTPFSTVPISHLGNVIMEPFAVFIGNSCPVFREKISMGIQKIKLDVCLSVHRCICIEKKNQLDIIVWFIALMMRSTCFGHFYAHQQERKTICMLLPPMVCSAWLLAVGVRCRQQGVCPGRGMLRKSRSIPLSGRTPCFKKMKVFLCRHEAY